MNLLNPRYIQLDIIPGFHGKNWQKDSLHHGECAIYGTIKFRYEKYPHLFRKLYWWERRQQKQLPEYLKTDSGVIFKVKMDSYNFTAYPTMPFVISTNEITVWLTWSIPTTKEIYEAYLELSKSAL